MAIADNVSNAVMTLKGLSFEDYEMLRRHPGNRDVRMVYYDGTLEVMSPEYMHESPTALLTAIINATATVFLIPYLETRSTTFKKPGEKKKGVGREPDTSFYFRNLAAVRHQPRIDLRTAPPPDLWVEVDNRGSSKGRLPLYASLGVPEVWRYRARTRRLMFLSLVDGRYAIVEQSLSLPMLTPTIVLDLLAKDETAPSTLEWGIAVRHWLDTVLKPQYEAAL